MNAPRTQENATSMISYLAGTRPDNEGARRRDL
jgi:hypothetical protein